MHLYLHVVTLFRKCRRRADGKKIALHPLSKPAIQNVIATDEKFVNGWYDFYRANGKYRMDDDIRSTEGIEISRKRD